MNDKLANSQKVFDESPVMQTLWHTLQTAGSAFSEALSNLSFVGSAHAATPSETLMIDMHQADMNVDALSGGKAGGAGLAIAGLTRFLAKYARPLTKPFVFGGTRKMVGRLGNEARSNIIAPNTDKANQAPYHPRTTENLLREKYPGEVVTSTTLPHPSMPNVKLAGKGKTIADGTHVPFDSRGFPIFDKHVAYEMKLPASSWSKDRKGHMREATRALRESIKRGEISRNFFGTEQLKDINKGKAEILDFTWHHHAEHGRMQLIPESIHNSTKHVGGMSLWGKKE